MQAGTVTVLLKAILTASWQGSIVIVLILLIRPLLGLRVPARCRCVLWMFALVRLLAPDFILPRVPTNLQNIPVIERTALAIDDAYENDSDMKPIGSSEPTPAESAGARAAAPVFRPINPCHKIEWWKLGSLVWGAGASLFAAWIFCAQLRLRRKIAREEGVAVDKRVWAIWKACAQRLSLSTTPRLMVTKIIETPALVGGLRPVLLIPKQRAQAFSNEDWEHIFMHELAHVRRKDHWIHALQLLALCLHWFNPMVWLGFRFLSADREIAADELALERLGGDRGQPEVRSAAYGKTLLKLLSNHVPKALQPGMIGILDDTTHLKQRFRRIVAFGPPKTSVAGFGVILIAAAVVLGRETNPLDRSRYNAMKPEEAFVTAASNNDRSAMRMLLEKGVDPNCVSALPGEKTALAAAAAANRIEAVRFLIAKGARINPQEGNKPSPALLAAQKNGSLDCANYLISMGAIGTPQASSAGELATAGGKNLKLSVPAERGRILDRNGKTLATDNQGFTLALVFPALQMAESNALAFAHEQIGIAQRALKRSIAISDQKLLSHSRALLPLDIAEELSDAEQVAITKLANPAFFIHPTYRRFYPNGSLAAHLLGFVAKSRRPLASSPQQPQKAPQEPGQSNPSASLAEGREGRDGLERTLDDILSGKAGQLTNHYNAQGTLVSTEATEAPQMGQDVVTTLDSRLQAFCEQALKETGKPGAMVVIDPTTGDVLAMASWPTFDPNLFIPSIAWEKFDSLNRDPDTPLVARAYRAAYPPGSTFKIVVGLAGLQSGSIQIDERIPNPPSLEIEGRTFYDWKKSDSGSLTLAEAIEQSGDTWFYQAGNKIGAGPIVDWALKLGFSQKTGVPLSGEAEGVIPTEQYLQKILMKDQLSSGEVANLSVGQGYTLVTPIQMAQAMATLANDGMPFSPRLIQQTQTREGKITSEYKLQSKAPLQIKPEFLAELKKAMVGVVSSGRGTAHKAAVNGIEVAGKTATAQYRTGEKSLRACWFAGFAPANAPKYAFAAVVEDTDNRGFGGVLAAPVVGKVLREIFAGKN